MSDFTKYLTETIKEYQYKIKFAGDLADGFQKNLKTALDKYQVKSLSAGKNTPIQEVPLDFPALKNTAVTIFDFVSHYPASVFELRSYIANHFNMSVDKIVVRKPGEPTEDYQNEINAKPKSEYKAKLHDIEYKDAPAVKADEVYGNKHTQSLLKELLKDKKAKFEIEQGSDNKTQETQSKELENNPSPVKAAHKGPVKGNPHTAGAK